MCRPFPFIHPVAERVNSPKSRCRIVHNTGPLRALRRIPDVGRHTSRH